MLLPLLRRLDLPEFLLCFAMVLFFLARVRQGMF